MTGRSLPIRLDGAGLTLGGREVIAPMTVELPATGCVAVLGPNGAGKSSFLRLCHGLLAPSVGRVSYGTLPAAAAHIRQTMVFQEPKTLNRSVRANIDHALRARGLSRADRRRRIELALARTGLADLAVRSARTLSGGEGQRLSIARAWALEPEIVFMDEPTANLDPPSMRAVETLIADMRCEGAAIMLTTHDLGQARRLADTVLLIHRGRIIEIGPAADFFAGPGTALGAAYLRGEILDSEPAPPAHPGHSEAQLR